MQSLSPIPAQCKAYHCSVWDAHMGSVIPNGHTLLLQSLMPAQCKAYHQRQLMLSSLLQSLPTACPSEGPTFPPAQRTTYWHR